MQLNGTSSSDPDNDPLTYAWTAPGIAFDDPTSATPTGTFPLGTRTATLVVSAGIQSDDDTVDVQVVDSNPPVIVCPTNLLIECNAPGGVPATDPQIVAFLAGASATDTCDVAPVLANAAPGFSPLGATPVTFTATDASNNQASCIATVTVQDTTPPEIRARVEPTRLWPPNHKLVDIAATVTVTDICDPAPTFELTKTKFSKTFSTFFFPVGEEVREIVTEWVSYLRNEKMWGNDEPLFPATRIVLDPDRQFTAAGLARQHWSNAAPIRTIFREAFVSAGLPYFNSHSFRNTLVQLGQKDCQTPEQFKAWSQNLGHEKVFDDFSKLWRNYVPTPGGNHRQVDDASKGRAN